MLAVIKERVIYFPEYMVNAHNQGVKHSRDRYFNNFIFITFNDASNLPTLHNFCKAFCAPVLNNKRMLLGINIDVTGGVNTVRVEPTIKRSDKEGGSTDIMSMPFYSPVEVPIEKGEWNIIADYPALHDYCAALLHLGISPAEAIAKTMSAMGHPNGNNVASLELNKLIKLLAGTYNKNEEPNEQDILFDLIRPRIKSMLEEGK